MELKIIFKIAPLALIIVALTMFAMQPAETIEVLTSDNITIRIPRDIAMQSSMISNMIADLGTNAPLPVSLTAQSFNLIIRMLQMINASPDQSKLKRADGGYIAQRIQPIIERMLAEENRSTVAELIYAAEFLNFEQIANGAIRVFVQKALTQNPNATIETIKELLSAAINWPINLNPVLEYQYQLVTNGNIPELSIKDYIAIRGMPGVTPQWTTLVLSNKGITSLEGLNEIRNIEFAKIIEIDGNKLTTIPYNIFNQIEFKQLSDIDLSGNIITNLPDTIQNINQPYTPFSSLKKLTDLSLSNNRLTTLPPTLFNGLTTLKMLHLENNQLDTLPNTVFNGLTKLNYVYLVGNKLATLAPTIFNGLPMLKGIALTNNPIFTTEDQMRTLFNLGQDVLIM